MFEVCSCIRDSVSKLLHVCCIPKDVIGFYDDCMLRFSNRSIFGTVEVAPRYRMINLENVTSLDQVNQALRNLLDGLRRKAASGGSLGKLIRRQKRICTGLKNVIRACSVHS
ncbi:hypothetical protein Ddye_019186 [Dipteronia dyeriana]|uniref:Uncharacterized protein n=1 Tax=Dipteronia dyeriana TaxID=168575 RepID=A0AAD9TXI1_9ROSI|nr:hypothetical protein Ddye_019186 [Dipteronia dyeriana]